MTATLVTFKVTHWRPRGRSQDILIAQVIATPPVARRVAVLHTANVCVVSRRTTDASLPRSANKTPSKYHADMKSIAKVF